MDAEQLIRAGNAAGALAALQAGIRANPSDARLRVFLFQLLCVTGDWHRAVQQLKTAATLDPTTEMMARMYREAIVAELWRDKVFAGEKSPGFRNDPPDWLTNMAEALRLDSTGDAQAAADMRAKAMDAAPATPGTLNGTPFDWLADADARLGPVLEVVLNGAYIWLPFADIRQIAVEPPSDLRDLVWTPVTLDLTDGTQTIGLVPTRYPGSHASDGHALARATDWTDQGAGLGQRMLITDMVDMPLFDMRTATFGTTEADHG